MKNLYVIVFFLASSFFLQCYFDFVIEKRFISSLLIVLSMFFGFYITSFAVFATSKYLSKLYQIENETDNRKTLLDDLLEIYSWPSYFLLSSIVYLIFLYILIENNFPKLLCYFSYLLWGVIALNIFYIFKTIHIFIKITRQSAKES